MRKCVLTTGSQTYAIKGRKLLASMGIGARLVRLNAKTAAKGCAYGIEIDCAFSPEAAGAMRREGIPFTGIAEGSEVL